MKIAMLVPSLVPTGPVRVALDQSAALRQAGHQVQVFYFDEKSGAVTAPQARRIRFFERFAFEDFDWIHSHGLRPDAYIWWHRPKVATATTLHNYAAEDLGYLYPNWVAKSAAWAWRYFVKRHSIRIALSHHMKNYYTALDWQQPIAVVPNSRPKPTHPPNPALAAQITAFAKGRVVLGNVSHYTPRKGLTQIIDLLVTNPAFVFVHIGSNTAELAQYAQQKGVASQCLWLGPQPQAAEQLVLLDVFVMPSYSEGFPLALLEAIAANVPAVVSNLPVFEDLLPETAVARFELGNVVDLQNAITTTLQDRVARVTAAKALYEQLYTPEAVVAQLLAVYAAFLEGRR
jgi:L-malate glycosyltransferase